MSREMQHAFAHAQPSPPTSLTDEDHTHVACTKLVTDSVLWQVSGNVQHAWRDLARILGVKEVDLMFIACSAGSEIAGGESDPGQTLAYRALRRWRDDVGRENATYGVLYSALCHPLLNLRLIANRYCTVDGVCVTQ